MARKPRHLLVQKIVHTGVLVYAYGYMGFMQTALCWFFCFTAPGI